MKPLVSTFALLAFLSSTTPATASEVRYFEKDGVTYRETKIKTQRPIDETQYRNRQRLVYREQVTTDLKHSTHTVQVPVTEYRWEAYWQGRWNPFRKPVLAQRYVSRTRWEARTATVSVPVTRRELIPEMRVDRVPVTTRRMVEEEVISRVAVTPSRPADPFARPAVPAMASRQPVGGLFRLDNDPPRASTRSGWRASSSTLRR